MGKRNHDALGFSFPTAHSVGISLWLVGVALGTVNPVLSQQLTVAEEVEPRTAGERINGITSRPNPWFEPRYELPDEFVARQSCERFRARKGRLDAKLDGRDEEIFIQISLREPPEIVIQAFVDASKLCHRFENGEHPLDTWWQDFLEIESRLEKLVDWCANCSSYRIEPDQALPPDYPAYALFLLAESKP